MPSIADRLLNAFGLQRFQPYTPEEIAAMWGSGMFSGYVPQTTLNNKQEPIGSDFVSLIANAYAGNPIVFACEQARVDLFSEARFVFQKMTNGVPGELFTNPRTYLRLLETPWPGGTTSELLKTMLIDADFGGNGLVCRRPTMLQRLRPDWTVIIAGNPRSDATTWDLDTEILGYGYQPDGPTGGKDKIFLQRSEVAHFKTTNDPLKRFSGMPWLVPVIREMTGDNAATSHKLKFYENAATPNMAIKFDNSMTLAQAKDWIELFKKDHQGSRNAFKTLFLGGGASMEVIGANLEQADFARVQGAGELRIASAAGVPPIIVGLAGGLEAATYSNYGQARRAFADLKMRPLWRGAAGALQTITNVPDESRLWYDDKGISFLQEDMQDAAAIQQTQASTIRQMLDAGFTPESAKDAVISQDWNRLQHSGLFSVQLQPSSSANGSDVDIPKLIEQVKADLLTIDEARAKMGLGPIKYDETPTPSELIEQTKGGLISIDEARALMGKPPMVWDTTPDTDELVKQLSAGLMSVDEARNVMGLGPMEWDDSLTHDEIGALIAQVESGLLTNDEARAKMGLPPMDWGEDLNHDEIGALLAELEAGVITHDEVREKLKLGPMQWPENPGKDEVDALNAQIESGLLTIEEARQQLNRPAITWPDDLNAKIEQAGGLIRAGFDPADVLNVLGLPPIKHLGLPPVTVQKIADAEGVAPTPEPSPMPESAPAMPGGMQP